VVLKKEISRGVEKDFRDRLSNSKHREKTSRKFYLYQDQIEALSGSEMSDSELLRGILDEHLSGRYGKASIHLRFKNWLRLRLCNDNKPGCEGHIWSR